MADDAPTAKVSVTTDAGRVKLRFPMGDREGLLNLPVSGAAQLGFVLLHSATEADAKADTVAVTTPGEARAYVQGITIPQVRLGPDGDLVLTCVAQGGLTFHLRIDPDTARSLAQTLAGQAEPQGEPTRQ